MMESEFERSPAVDKISTNRLQAEGTPLISGDNKFRNLDTVVSPSSGHVFMKLLLHSILMFSLPFCTYFGIKSYLEKEFNMQSPQSYIYAVIGVVIVVHIIIASYVYQAFKEEESSKRLTKKQS